jgi:hypothetical protein
MIALKLFLFIISVKIYSFSEIKGTWKCVNNSVKSEIETGFTEEKDCSMKMKFIDDSVYINSGNEMGFEKNQFSYELINDLLFIGNSTYVLKKWTNDSLVIKDTVLDLPPIGPFFHEKVFIRAINNE